MLVQGDRTGDPDLLSEAKRFLKVRFNKPGNAFLGLVHRLDRPVSGVVVFARTSKAAKRLSAQFRARTVDKTYLAIVEGRIAEALRLRDYLRKERPRSRVVSSSTPGSREAVLSCRPIMIIRSQTLVKISLETGRAHQIRAQLAHKGHPVVGDRRYGAASTHHKGSIALHCWRMGVEHPVRRETIHWSAPPPETWPEEVLERFSSKRNYLA